MNMLFFFTLFAILGSYLTFGYVTKDLPLEMSLDMLWVEVPWMIIPIFTVIYSIKNINEEKAKRNIVAGMFVIIFLIPGLIPPNNKIKYNEIYEYEKMFAVKFPRSGLLESESTSDINHRIENMWRVIAYYKKNININALEKQIINSDKWIIKSSLDNELINILPFVVEMNKKDELYILIYNSDTTEYNTKLTEQKKYDIYTAVYYKKYRALYIYHYQYNNE